MKPVISTTVGPIYRLLLREYPKFQYEFIRKVQTDGLGAGYQFCIDEKAYHKELLEDLSDLNHAYRRYLQFKSEQDVVEFILKWA